MRWLSEPESRCGRGSDRVISASQRVGQQRQNRLELLRVIPPVADRAVVEWSPHLLVAWGRRDRAGLVEAELPGFHFKADGGGDARSLLGLVGNQRLVAKVTRRTQPGRSILFD